jgi:hypothetical protein
MPFPTFAAGQVLTAGQLSSMQWQDVSQGSPQVVNNSETFVDTSIVIPVLSGALYMYQLLANWDGAVATGIKFTWTVPSGAAMTRFQTGPGFLATGGPDMYTESSYRRQPSTGSVAAGSAGLGLAAGYFEFGNIDGGNGGNVTLQFAQQEAGASNTTLNALTTAMWLRIG